MRRLLNKIDIKGAVSRLLPGRFVSIGCRDGGQRIALTFDDGPHAENTPRLLDRLDASNLRATFFVSGAEVERAPGLLRSIVARGHQVANHGFAHLNARKVSYDRYMDDIERANELIEQTIGDSIGRFMRPPYGALTTRVLLGLVSRRYRIIMWSVDSLDYAIHDKGKLQERFQSSHLEAGDIVLFHDDYAHTVLAMEGIAQTISERGLRSVTISELLVPRAELRG
jgi:peptidoglycan/xylan/chitin deacetylase (PgdA/CDA1 family)